MVRLYLASAAELDIESALKAVSPYRREKVMRLRDTAKKRASLAAELLLIRSCGRNDYVTEAGGKPYFEDGGVHFSLSHCGDIAACAIADSPVGVDIERVLKAVPEGIAKRFFTEADCALIDSADNAASAFCELWVQKEAIVKALGTGLAGLSCADVTAYQTAHYSYGEYRIGVCLIGHGIGDIEFHVQEDFSQII